MFGLIGYAEATGRESGFFICEVEERAELALVVWIRL